MRIGMLDEPSKPYATAIREAKTLDDLRAAIKRFELLAWDALAVAEKMSEEDFFEWRRGLARESSGKFAGRVWAQRFGQITIPDAMLFVELTASRFKVPFGLAYNRLVDEGLLKIEDGRAIPARKEQDNG